MSGLNVIEQARFNRQLAAILERIQVAEGYFSGVPITTARIRDAAITNAKIGTAAITTAKIANVTILDAKVNDLSATKITTGTLDADRIGAATITASKLSVSTLSSITANLGSVNAGTISGVTITGGTVRTVSGGSRVEMTSSPERFTVWDGSNPRVRLGEGSAIIYGDEAVSIADSNQVRAYIDSTSSSFNVITTTESDFTIIANDGDLTFVADDVINVIATQVRFNGSPKTAIVANGDTYSALYCAESPGVWFMDFDKGVRDSTFAAVTVGRYVEFDCLGGEKLVFARRRGFDKHRFEQMTLKQAQSNREFYAT